MAQQLVEKKGIANQELARTGRMALYGGCIFGPAATKWFGFLQRKVVFPGRPNTEIVARVLVDQTVFASTNLFVFLSTMALMEGTDPREKLASTYGTAIQKNWMLWPAVQFVNFKFVPLEHRVMLVNFVALGESVIRRSVLTFHANLLLGWNCYLSLLNGQPGGAHDPDGGLLPPE
jgi:protein Mpv17